MNASFRRPGTPAPLRQRLGPQVSQPVLTGRDNIRVPRPMLMKGADGKLVSLRKPLPEEQARIKACAQVLKIPDFAQLAAAGAGPPLAPTTSPEQQLEFLAPGWIVGALFDSKNASTHANRSSLAVRIFTVGQTSALTTDTKDRAYIPISLLSPDMGAAGLDVWPLVRHVEPYDKLSFSFQNLNTGGAQIPTGAVLFVPDEQVPDCVRPDPVGSSLPACTRAMLTPGGPDPVNFLAPGIWPDQIVTWQYDGIVNAFRADNIADATGSNRANIAFLIDTWGGDRMAITTDGRASAWVTSTLLTCGPEQALRLLRRVEIRDQWRVSVQNTGAGNLAPSSCFFLDGDRDILTRSLYEV